MNNKRKKKKDTPCLITSAIVLPFHKCILTIRAKEARNNKGYAEHFNFYEIQKQRS
jgi:hypothetical protein